MRRLVLALSVMVVGCASSNGVSQSSPTMETMHVQPAFGTPMAVAMIHEESSNGGSVPVAMDQAWLALRTVYDSLGIPIATLDPATHTIGNSSFKIRRKLGNVSLSKYINCGTMQGAPSADSYDIVMTVMTTARRDGAKTLVMTTVEGQGRPVSLSGDYVRCSSTTALETRIVEMVNSSGKR